MGDEDQPTDSWQWQKDLYAADNLKKYSEMVKRFALLADKNDVDLLFVLMPLTTDSLRVEWNNSMKLILDEAGIRYLDLYPAFIKEFKNTDPVKLLVSPVNSHPGEMLNLFFMDEIFAYLKKQKYLSDDLSKRKF